MNKSLHLCWSVIWALFCRDSKDRIFEAGVLNLFMPLLIQLFIQLTIYYFFKKQTIMGMNKVIFIVAGFIPFLLWERSIIDSTLVFTSSKNSLAIKQIKIFDAVIASCFTNLITSLIIYTVSLFIVYLIVDSGFQIYNWMNIILSLSIAFTMAVGISLITVVLGAYLKSAYLWVLVFTRFFYFVSGIFFPVQLIPPSLRTYLLLNPLLQLVELGRYAFIPTSARDGVTFIYPLIWAIGFLFLGLCVYLSFKNIFLKKAFA